MQTVEKYEVKRAVRREIEVDVPGSKSITNRALLIAALAEGKSVLEAYFSRMTAGISCRHLLISASRSKLRKLLRWCRS